MSRTAKKILWIGTDIMLAGIFLPTILAFGYNILIECGLIHILPDTKQEAMREVLWYTGLIELCECLLSIGFGTIIVGAILGVISLRRTKFD